MKFVGIIFVLTISLVLVNSCKHHEHDVPIPPVAAFTLSPDTLYTTTMVRFDCSLSEPGNDQDKIYYRWDWNSDGIWDEEYSHDPVFMHRFYNKDRHKALLEVLNSSGLTDTCSVNLNVEQGYSSPRALFNLIPESGNRITEFTFDASVTIDDEDSLDQLMFRWDWEGDGNWDTGFSSKEIVKHSYFETGDFQPTLEVIDPTGLKNQFKQKLFVNQNNPNLHIEFIWEPLHPLQEDTVLFDASLSRNPDDPDNVLLYYWKFSLGEPLKNSGWLGPFHEPTISKVFTMEHEYSVALKIVDENSLEKELSLPVRVFHLNRPPVSKFNIGQKIGNLTTQFYLDAWPTDDIEDRPSQIKVRWDFEGDQIWDTEFSEEKYYYHKYTAPGVYKIILEAMDTEGLKDTTSTFVTVTSGTNETGLIIDRRSGGEEFYPTVKIGDQWWTAKNMFYEPGILSDKIDTLRSTCYISNELSPNESQLCHYYGLLYTAYSASDMKMWEGVQGICPSGWHLPTKNEWEILIITIGGYSAAKELLVGGSTDFNALFSGWGKKISEGTNNEYWFFEGRGEITYFWSSRPLYSSPALNHWNIALLKGQDRIYPGYSGNANFLSVRCIKNE